MLIVKVSSSGPTVTRVTKTSPQTSVMKVTTMTTEGSPGKTTKEGLLTP